MKNISVKISNQRITPYRLNSSDRLLVKVNVFDGNKIIKIGNISASLWLTYPTTWQQYKNFTINNGNATIYQSCNSFSNINYILGYVKIFIGNNTYNSNIVRFNFINSLYLYTIEEIIIEPEDVSIIESGIIGF